MDANSKKALEFADWLCQTFPEYKFYIPSKLDALLSSQGVNPIDVVDSLLDLDCAIVQQSNALLMFLPNDYISPGMEREQDIAIADEIPYLCLTSHILEHKEMTKYCLTNFFEGIK